MKNRIFTTIGLIFCLAASLYAQQIDMTVAEAEEDFRWGVYAFHRSYYNEAIRSLETALSLQPGNTRIRYWLGKALYKTGYEEAALSEWNTILQSGVNDRLLANHIQMLSISRGVGQEIMADERLILTRTHDGGSKNYYPFKRPTSIKPKPDGSVFVVAYGSNEIITINANGVVTDIFKGGLGLDLYNHPFDLLAVKDGTIFITEYEGDQVSHCKANGDKISFFGKKGRKDGEFLGPQYIAADSKGYLYITDWGNNRVSKFDQEGNFILSFGQKKNPDSGTDTRLKGPTGIVIIDDLVYVADKNNRRIAVFDQSGNFIQSLGKGELWGPEGLHTSDANHILIADSRWLDGKTRLINLDIQQEKLTPVPGLPEDMQRIMSAVYDANGNLVAGDYNSNKILILSRMSDLYSGYNVEIERIEAVNFPEVTLDISVTDRYGTPVYGLENKNFLLTETENPVSSQLMYKPVSQQEKTEILLLVEKSTAMSKLQKELSQAVENLINLKGDTDFMIALAGETPGLASLEATGKMEIINRVSEGNYSAKWDLGTGLRLAASQLLPSRNRRAIIFLTSGRLGHRTLPGRSLLEVKQLLANNHIALHIINLDPGMLPEELVFLSDGTGGRTYSYYQPQGLLPVLENLSNRRDPRYILRYQSNTFPDFGKKYIELNVEVIMHKISGKDTLGYYAPLE